MYIIIGNSQYARTSLTRRRLRAIIAVRRLSIAKIVTVAIGIVILRGVAIVTGSLCAVRIIQWRFEIACVRSVVTVGVTIRFVSHRIAAIRIVSHRIAAITIAFGIHVHLCELIVQCAAAAIRL